MLIHQRWKWQVLYSLNLALFFDIYNGRSYKKYEYNSGTAYETYKEAVRKDSSIGLQYVTDYFSKRDDIRVKSKPSGSNSFVSPGAKFEFEMCIMDIFARDGGEGVRYGMVDIDYFIKVAEVIPSLSKTDNR